jgi:hypothetical protein
VATAKKIETGAHIAYLDAMNGAGILIAPNSENDVPLKGLPVELPGGLIGYSSRSLYEADWNSITRSLYESGWTLLDDEWEIPLVMGTLTDGRTIHWLYPRIENAAETPITDDETYARACMALVFQYFPQ